MLNVHWVNPMGSMLVPVAVTTVGNLSFVRLRLRDSKVLRLMQLIDAPVSYNALILMFEVVIGKIVPVVGLLLWCKYLQSGSPCYLHHCSNCWGCTAWVVNPEG